MQKRNVSEEILELKKRKEFDSFRDLSKKFDQLKATFDTISSDENNGSLELRKYIPVALISTMESFFRSTVKSIIEKNEMYLANSKSLFEPHNIKVNFDILSHLNKKNFTIGEFISHQLSFSKYEEIESCFSKLLNKEFIKELKKHKSVDNYPGKQNNSKLFIKNNESIIADIVELYKIRNIICHEMAFDVSLSKEKTLQLFQSAYIFINQVQIYIYDLLYPPVNDKEMAVKAKTLFQNSEKELNEFIEKVKANSYTYFGVKANLSKFLESHQLWINYRNAYVSSLMNGLEHNPIYESLYYEDMYDMTIDRLADLKIDFDNADYL